MEINKWTKDYGKNEIKLGGLFAITRGQVLHGELKLEAESEKLPICFPSAHAKGGGFQQGK